MTVGWGFMRFTTPTDQQIYDRLSPDLKRQFDREKERRRQDNDAKFEQMMSIRNLDRPAWRTDVPKDVRSATTGTTGEAGQRIPVSPDPHALDRK